MELLKISRGNPVSKINGELVKSDAELSFYYIGQFDIVDVKPAKKRDNSGKERDIAKFRMRMHHAVREDLLRYLQSKIVSAEEEAV